MPKRHTQSGSLTKYRYQAERYNLPAEPDGMKDGFKKDQISSSLCQRKMTGFIKKLFYDHLSKVNPLEVNRSGVVMQWNLFFIILSASIHSFLSLFTSGIAKPRALLWLMWSSFETGSCSSWYIPQRMSTQFGDPFFIFLYFWPTFVLCSTTKLLGGFSSMTLSKNSTTAD